MNIPFKCPTFVSVSLILCLKLQRDWRMWQEEHCIVPLCYGLPATLLSLEIKYTSFSNKTSLEIRNNFGSIVIIYTVQSILGGIIIFYLFTEL